MHLTILAFFSLIAIVQGAIQIPANQLDGVYIVEDIEGIETHTRIADVNTTALDIGVNTASTHLKSDFSWPPRMHTECDTTNVFFSNDFYQGAYNGFVTACNANKGKELEGGKALYVKYSTSAAYFCSYRKNPCVVEEWEDAVGRIQSKCEYTHAQWLPSGM